MIRYTKAKRLLEEHDSAQFMEDLERNGSFIHAEHPAARAIYPEREDGTLIRDVLWIDFRDGRYGYLARDGNGDYLIDDDGDEYRVDTGKLDTFYIRVGDRRWRFPGKVEVTGDGG